MEQLGVDQFMERNGAKIWRTMESEDDKKINDFRRDSIKSEKQSLTVYQDPEFFTGRLTF